MFRYPVTIPVELVRDARWEANEYNRVLIGRSLNLWFDASWVSLAHRGSMQKLIGSCRSFQEGTVCCPVHLLEEELEQYRMLTAVDMYECSAQGMMLKCGRVVLCTHVSNQTLPEMRNDGGWLVLGSIYDSEPERSDTEHASFWAAGDRLGRDFGASRVVYATFQVVQGQRYPSEGDGSGMGRETTILSFRERRSTKGELKYIEHSSTE